MLGNYKISYFAISVVAALGSLLLLLAGCSDSPTASQSPADAPREMWNPGPGAEVIPGREVPMLRDGYWEEVFGSEINPNRRAYNSFTPINELGGTVTLGYHSYVIPAGAVDEPRTFTLSYASLSAVAVDCGPSPYYFNLPVLLTLSYRGTQYEEDGMDPSDLRIYYVSPDGTYEELESTLDTESRCIRAYVDHFSRYVIA